MYIHIHLKYAYICTHIEMYMCTHTHIPDVYIDVCMYTRCIHQMYMCTHTHKPDVYIRCIYVYIYTRCIHQRYIYIPDVYIRCIYVYQMYTSDVYMYTYLRCICAHIKCTHISDVNVYT